MYLFFDTETTGLPKSYKAKVEDVNNWPRMVQIAWSLYDEKKQEIEFMDFIIKPEGYTIPKEVSKIHRITTEMANEKGHNLADVLTKFADRIEKADYVIAHNISFDEKIVGAEFIRTNIAHNYHKKQKICTMQSSTNFCKISGNYGYKWPKLSELHTKLFNTDFEDAHNAAVDISATVRCFWKLIELKVIKLQ